jgi:hypothetical protein
VRHIIIGSWVLTHKTIQNCTLLEHFNKFPDYFNAVDKRNLVFKNICNEFELGLFIFQLISGYSYHTKYFTLRRKKTIYNCLKTMYSEKQPFCVSSHSGICEESSLLEHKAM